MAEAVRVAMRQLAEKHIVEHHGPPNGDFDRRDDGIAGRARRTTGDSVARSAVGDDAIGPFMVDPWAWFQASCDRTSADGPNVERRSAGVDPIAAAAVAQSGLSARTIMRAAEPRPGQTALVIGATTVIGRVLVPLLAEAGAHVIATAGPGDEDDVRSLGATDVECTTVAGALASHADVDLLVDLVSFGEPYFITAAAPHGMIVTVLPGPCTPGIPRIEISAEPGELAALAQRALDERRPRELARA